MTYPASITDPNKFHPGYYLFLASTGDVEIPQSSVDYISSIAEIKGIKRDYKWRHLEPTLSNYDFSKITADLDKLDAVEKKLIIHIQSITFNSAEGPATPPYMWANSQYGGDPRYYGTYERDSGAGGWIPARWVAATEARELALVSAVMSQLSSHNAFAGMIVSETANTRPATVDQYGYSGPGYAAALYAMVDHLQTIANGYPVYHGYNFPPAGSGMSMSAFAAYMASHDVGIFTPDYKHGHATLLDRYAEMLSNHDNVPIFLDIQWSNYTYYSSLLGRVQTVTDIRDGAISEVNPWFMAWQNRSPYWPGDIVPAVQDTDLPAAVQFYDGLGGGGEVIPAERRINCGSGQYIDTVGATWEADNYYDTGFSSGSGDAVTGTSDQELFQNARLMVDNTTPIIYSIPVTNGAKNIDIGLNEYFWTADNSRSQKITIDGNLKEDNIDIHAEVGHDVALVKTYTTTVANEICTVEIGPGSAGGSDKKGIVAYIRIYEGSLPSQPAGYPLRINVGGSAENITTLLHESQFTGSDATALTAYTPNTGAGFSQYGGSWTLSGNRAVNSSDANSWRTAAATASGEANVLVRCAVTVASGVAIPFVLIRGSDNDHFWIIRASTANDFSIREFDTGSLTTRASASPTIDPNDELVIEAEADGTTITARVSVNGGAWTEISYGSATYNQTATAHGFGELRDGVTYLTSNYFDEFTIHDLITIEAWEADRDYSPAGTVDSAQELISGTTKENLFRTSRRAASIGWSLALNNSNVDVKLYLAELTKTASAQRVFDVDVQSVSKETGIDVFNEVGANTALIKTYSSTVTDGTLAVDLTASTDEASLNAIEILATSTIPATPPWVDFTVVSETQIDLLWGTSTGASSYKVYRDGVEIANPTANSYSDTGLSYQLYEYTITALNSSGESVPSDVRATYPADETAPTVPSNNGAFEISASSISVYSDGSTDTGSGVSFYWLREAATQFPNTEVLSFPFDLTGLPAFVTLTMTLSAVDAYGNESAQSASFEAAAAEMPDVPLNAVAAPQGGSETILNLAWDAVAGAMGYRVYEVPPTVVSDTLLIDVGATSYQVTGLSAWQTKHYKVAAWNSVGEGEKSAAFSGRTLDLTSPAGGSINSVEQVGATAVFDITPATDAGSGVAGYYLWNDVGEIVLGEPPYAIITDANPQADISFTGATYSWTIQPFDVVGNVGTMSAAVELVALSVYPDYPQSYENDREPLEQVIWDRANGNLRGRVLHTKDNYEFSIVHSYITDAQRQILDDFWTQNRGVLVNLVLQDTGETHQCFMRKRPKFIPIAYDGTDHSFRAIVEFIQ